MDAYEHIQFKYGLCFKKHLLSNSRITVGSVGEMDIPVIYEGKRYRKRYVYPLPKCILTKNDKYVSKSNLATLFGSYRCGPNFKLNGTLIKKGTLMTNAYASYFDVLKSHIAIANDHMIFSGPVVGYQRTLEPSFTFCKFPDLGEFYHVSLRCIPARNGDQFSFSVLTVNNNVVYDRTWRGKRCFVTTVPKVCPNLTLWYCSIHRGDTNVRTAPFVISCSTRMITPGFAYENSPFVMLASVVGNYEFIDSDIVDYCDDRPKYLFDEFSCVPYISGKFCFPYFRMAGVTEYGLVTLPMIGTSQFSQFVSPPVKIV
jgi:hypothetical protein